MLESEHIYTYAGWQRPVFLCPDTQSVRFAAEGVSRVQTSYDRPDDLKKGQGQWLEFDGVSNGMAAGAPHGITALRVQVNAAGEGRLKVVRR